jgi:hypothetical protein
MKRYKDTPYFVTTDGKVFRDGKQLKTYKSKYESFGPSINGIQKTVQIHVWIAQTFIPNPENKREVNHKDGNGLNNNVDNLEWNTHQENMMHSTRILGNSTKENHNMVKLNQSNIQWIRKNYIPKHKQFGMNALGRKYKVSPMTIHKIIHNKTWT